MRWSKLKQTIEARFADSLAGRVEVFSTRYRHAHDEDGRGWITVDGREIANMSDITMIVSHFTLAREMQVAASATNFRDPEQAPRYYSAWEDARQSLHTGGVFGRYEFTHALWDSLSLTIDDMLRSENGIIRALAMLDRRLGKRRLRAFVLPDDELPLVRTLHALRCEAEGVAPETVPAPGSGGLQPAVHPESAG